jgi:LacI family transcriptional regulator
MDKKYTLESIAELAGVSRATVSRVINNQKYVKEDIRKKVMDTINSVGYVPNAVARSLVSKKTNNIGVLVFGLDPYFLSNQVYFEIIQGIHEEALKNNYDLMLYSTKGKSSDVCYKIIGKRMIDVLIVMGEKIDIELLKILYDSDLPIILIGKRDTKGMDIPYVCSNYERGAFTAVNYLINRGLKRIAIIQCFRELLHEQKKLTGYKIALQKAKIPIDEDLIIEGGAQQDIAYTEVLNLLEKHPDIDGIFAASDFMAMGAVQAIQHIGKSVPDDISVIGYDDIASAHIFSPALTTIRQDKRALGVNAVKLYNALMNQESVTPVILETELITRNTTK